jgi:predicted nuclease with TOPRIM domain
MMADNLNSDRLNRQIEILKKMNPIESKMNELGRTIARRDTETALMKAELDKLQREYSQLNWELTRLLEEAFAQ